MRARWTALLASFVLLVPASAAAQGIGAWDAPIFLPPRPGDDLGVYLIDPSGGEWALAGIWRQSGNLNLGVRAGIADDEGDDGISVLFGAEFYGPIARSGRAFPLDIAWLLGAGATVNDGTFLRIPAGLSIGRVFASGGLVFLPYAVPRVALDIFAVGDETETEFSFTADLGVDLEIDRSLLLRFGVALGEHDAIGVGLAWRWGRSVAAR